MKARAPKSYLFVPGHRPERYAKAYASGADAVIVDLEDAVALDDKSVAWAALTQWLPSAPPVLVRINSVETRWFSADIELCRLGSVAAVMLPKAECAEDVEFVVRHTGRPVVALIETAQDIANAVAIAGVEGVVRLAFGALDLANDLGMADGAEGLDCCRLQLVLASRIGGLDAPIDGVTTAIDDAALIEQETRRAKRNGFGAKLCIHPKQVNLVNRCFAPTADELAWAQRIIEAAGQGGGGSAAVDGKMVDTPVIVRAQRILDSANR